MIVRKSEIFLNILLVLSFFLIIFLFLLGKSNLDVRPLRQEFVKQSFPVVGSFEFVELFNRNLIVTEVLLILLIRGTSGVVVVVVVVVVTARFPGRLAGRGGGCRGGLSSRPEPAPAGETSPGLEPGGSLSDLGLRYPGVGISSEAGPLSDGPRASAAKLRGCSTFILLQFSEHNLGVK